MWLCSISSITLQFSVELSQHRCADQAQLQLTFSVELHWYGGVKAQLQLSLTVELPNMVVLKLGRVAVETKNVLKQNYPCTHLCECMTITAESNQHDCAQAQIPLTQIIHEPIARGYSQCAGTPVCCGWSRPTSGCVWSRLQQQVSS